MLQKVKLIREDGYDFIYLKLFKHDGSLNEEEFKLSYDEWDAAKKERIEKNVYNIELISDEFKERMDWLLEPQRMVLILKALNPKLQKENMNDLPFMFSLGSLSEEYCNQFKVSMFYFMKEARMAKQILETMITKIPEKEL